MFIAPELFEENLSLTLEYRDQRSQNQKFNLPHEPLKDSIILDRLPENCIDQDFIFSGSQVATECELSETNTINLSYKYVSQHKNRFPLTDAIDISKASFTIWVNDQLSKDFFIDSEAIEFISPLPLFATVKVRVTLHSDSNQ